MDRREIGCGNVHWV